MAARRGRGDRLGAPEVEIGPDDQGLEGTAPLGARRGHVARLPRALRGASPIAWAGARQAPIAHHAASCATMSQTIAPTVAAGDSIRV